MCESLSCTVSLTTWGVILLYFCPTLREGRGPREHMNILIAVMSRMCSRRFLIDTQKFEIGTIRQCNPANPAIRPITTPGTNKKQIKHNNFTMGKDARLGFYAPGTIGQVKASDPRNQPLLESIASDPSLVKILQHYKYHIELLRDCTKEEEKQCYGHNAGMGQEIALNCNSGNPVACDITTNDDSRTVMDTMLHEVAHCDESGGLSEYNRKHHNKAFHDRRKELKQMYIELESWKQKGTQLGGKKKCSPWLSLLWGGVLYYGCSLFIWFFVVY